MSSAVLEKVSDNPVIQSRYEQMRKDGVSHNLAEMFAFQKPPRANDDTTWLASQSSDIGGAFLDDAPEIVQRHYVEQAEAAGVNIKGSVYVPGLARHPGDPEAWVKNASEIKSRVEQRGWGCEGVVNVKADANCEPIPDVDIAPDLVERRAHQMIEANPDLKMGPDLLNEARDAIKPHWAK